MILPCLPSSKQDVLTAEQLQMYASEKLENFRWISKIVATYSTYTLTDADFAPESLYQELAELGQFAEVAYSAVPIDFLLNNLAILRRPGYPLENYEAFNDIILVDSFRGSFADLPVYTVYRPHSEQLVLAISGTSSVKQALQDLRVLRTSHPRGRGTVHTGFWYLYQGVKTQALQAIQKGLSDHSVKELVLTGHSMGGCIAYLLCMDLLAEDLIADGLKLQIAVFGAPRTGDSDLVEYYQDLVASYRERQGRDAFREYSVKGYNDGVPALPPARLGYRHFCKEPIYTVGGKLYRTPATESEHALFHVLSDSNDGDQSFTPIFPRGGHNYYNGRDLERFARRIAWLDRAKPTEQGWEDRYTALSTHID
ncbi:Alpha/Beta hydrolase protein [Crassisporium funariophilum]|nr:Alpha/Beta hydrolase protein [Crassisporium funariophilum]